jgi:hypothetical protein
MQGLLRRACHATNLARERGVTLKPGLIALIERRYDLILAQGFVFHEAQPTLGPVDKLVMAPARSERLGRRDTQAATGVTS